MMLGEVGVEVGGIRLVGLEEGGYTAGDME